MDITYKFTAGTRAVAQQVNQNFADVKSAVDPLETAVTELQSDAVIKSNGSVDFTRLQSYATYVVSNATNATPIIVTAVAHSFLTGDKVFISGVGGNTAANGTFTITKIGVDTFSLDGSVGNGAFSSNGTALIVPVADDNIASVAFVKDYNITSAFAKNSGYVDTSGNADLLAGTTSTTLTFKVDSGTTYKPLKITYADKSQETLTSLTSITGLSTNGSYTILKEKGLNPVAVLSTTVTQGKTFPTSPTNGDYHCLTATGLQTYKRVSGAWVETQYVPIGTATVASNVISAVSTNPYNRNGYDTNEASSPSNKYIDLTLGANGSTYIAPADGWFEIWGTGNNGQFIYLGAGGLQATSIAVTNPQNISCYLPIKKGITISYGYNVYAGYIRFIYAEGSKP